MSFKDKWNAVDEKCPSCHQVTKRVRGISKQNLKRLVRVKGDVNEIVLTIILIMLFLISFLYKSETQQCRDWLKPMYSSQDKEQCRLVCDARCEMINFTRIQELNLSINNFSLRKDYHLKLKSKTVPFDTSKNENW